MKNLKLLIDAFGILRERLKDTNLVIVGDGEEKEDLVNYVESLGLDKEILFTGPLANPYSLMAKSMLITLTSISEALPTVIIEAFALGKTVVSTPTCGAIDLLSGGEYGYLTKRFDNPIEFAELMEKAIALPIDQKKLVDRANFFAVENQSTELIHLLNHL
ncbi:glycosyltransferase [Bacteroides fragilis]|nr:glycosyltransferase [Bacteroides fragilis]